MEGMVSSNAAMIDVMIYWIISMVVIIGFDAIAVKKLGGKHKMGYKVLQFPKFIAVSATSLISLVLMILFKVSFDQIKSTTETYLGVPYFAFWCFYMVVVMRRIRAEKHNRF